LSFYTDFIYYITHKVNLAHIKTYNRYGVYYDECSYDECSKMFLLKVLCHFFLSNNDNILAFNSTFAEGVWVNLKWIQCAQLPLVLIESRTALLTFTTACVVLTYTLVRTRVIWTDTLWCMSIAKTSNCKL